MGAPRLKTFPPPKKSEASANATEAQDKREIEALRQALQKKLKDPQEAKKAAQILTAMLEREEGKK